MIPELTPSANWWQNNFGNNSLTNNLDGSMVVPATLQSQWSALPATGSLYPYVWNGNIGWAAHQYTDCLEQDAGASPNPHDVTGAPALGDRFTDSGYTNWSNVGENIVRNVSNDINFTHSGFAIDWGTGIDGIQNPPGHRNSMLSTTFTEAGIGHLDTGWDAGSYSQTQHFGTQFADNRLAGYVYNSGNQYSFDNASVGATVQIKDAGGMVKGMATSDANGGYVIDLAGLGLTNGAQYTVMAVGGIARTFTYSDSVRTIQQNVSAVPEPSAFLFLGLAAIGAMGVRKKFFAMKRAAAWT